MQTKSIKKLVLNPTFLKFIYSGVFMRALAIILNYTFAVYLELNIRIVYFVVLIIDFTIGFLLNRFLVFTQSFNRSNRSTFFAFIIAGIIFRTIDWGIYVFLVEKLLLHITLAQICSILLIMLLKFTVYNKIFK